MHPLVWDVHSLRCIAFHISFILVLRDPVTTNNLYCPYTYTGPILVKIVATYIIHTFSKFAQKKSISILKNYYLFNSLRLNTTCKHLYLTRWYALYSPELKWGVVSSNHPIPIVAHRRDCSNNHFAKVWYNSSLIRLFNSKHWTTKEMACGSILGCFK